MTASATGKILARLRSVGAAMRAGARQTSRPRALATAIGLLALVVVAFWVPVPSAVQVRDWAQSVGPWLPLAFFAAHVAATVVPFPRTAFTLAAGLLFGPLLGIAIAVAASTTSAVVAMLVIRTAGWRLDRLNHRAVHRVDERLRERGWVAVFSLRLIPVMPFSAINYAAGASAVRLVPYTLATVAGLLPGTTAVVILGDALAGHPSPLLVLVSGCTAALGLTGLIHEYRHYRRRHRLHPSHDEPTPEEPAIVS